MAKETQPAQPGDLIQILELHPSDAHNKPLQGFHPLKELVTVIDARSMFQVKGDNGHRHVLLAWDDYPAYTIHRRAGATKNK